MHSYAQLSNELHRIAIDRLNNVQWTFTWIASIIEVLFGRIKLVSLHSLADSSKRRSKFDQIWSNLISKFPRGRWKFMWFCKIEIIILKDYKCPTSCNLPTYCQQPPIKQSAIVIAMIKFRGHHRRDRTWKRRSNWSSGEDFQASNWEPRS